MRLMGFLLNSVGQIKSSFCLSSGGTFKISFITINGKGKIALGTNLLRMKDGLFVIKTFQLKGILRTIRIELQYNIRV